MGQNFDDGKGNFTGYFVYHQQQPVTASARDFSDCQLISNGLVASPTFSGVECLGSSNSNRFNPEGIAPGTGTRYTVVGNQFLPWPQVGSSPPAVFDFNNFEYLQRQDKRFQAGFMAHERLNEHVQPYMEFGWMDDRSVAVIAPSGLFVGGDPFTSDGNELVNLQQSSAQRTAAGVAVHAGADRRRPGESGLEGQQRRRLNRTPQYRGRGVEPPFTSTTTSGRSSGQKAMSSMAGRTICTPRTTM